MNFKVRFTEEAASDLVRLYEFILEREQQDPGSALVLAEQALQAITEGISSLANSPFSYRKATTDNPFLRELVIPFGSTGYVALFEISDGKTVTILAVRHQREDDYY